MSTRVVSMAIGIGALVAGGVIGGWAGSMGGSRRVQAVAASEAARADASVSRLRAELAAAEAKMAALEAQLAEAKSAAATPTESAETAAAPAGPADLNTIFQQAKPLLQSLGPLFDNARRRGTQARAERKVAEFTEKYALSAEQQEAIKKWYADKSEADAARGRELLAKPGANLQDLMAAGRGQRPDDGLDEMMAATLNAEQLKTYQSDRLQERAATVEQEANRRVSQLDGVVQLDEAQQDQVFAIMARSSRDYDPAMQLEGLGTEVGPLAEEASRDEAILAVLRPEQRAAYEADRQRRREEAARNLEAIGIKPPADLGVFEGLGR